LHDEINAVFDWPPPTSIFRDILDKIQNRRKKTKHPFF
jgi:hypothetical protein